MHTRDSLTSSNVSVSSQIVDKNPLIKQSFVAPLYSTDSERKS